MLISTFDIISSIDKLLTNSSSNEKPLAQNLESLFYTIGTTDISYTIPTVV